MTKKWKPIKEYEELYELRSDGLIHSLPRSTTKGYYTYGRIGNNDRFSVVLSKNGKIKSKLVHRLVYETFVGEIPEGYDVHHINHNHRDNRVENLQLVEKTQHNELHKEDRISKTRKSVLQYTLNGNYIGEYESTSEAQRQTGVAQQNICSCCKGKVKTAGGFVWEYKKN